MTVYKISSYLNDLLHSSPVADYALNGLQVGKNSPVSKVALAVDARLSTFEKAADSGCQMLLVHHGLFWGRNFAITDAEYDRFSYLMSKGLALWASHIPLDIHPDLGNNARLLGALGVSEQRGFGDWKGLQLGKFGSLPSSLPLEELMGRLDDRLGSTARCLDFGKQSIQTIGVISGSVGVDEAHQALDAGIDLFVTGEECHPMHAFAQDFKFNIAFGGHYATEAFGIRAVGEKLSSELGLETIYIDHPTGL